MTGKGLNRILARRQLLKKDDLKICHLFGFVCANTCGYIYAVTACERHIRVFIEYKSNNLCFCTPTETVEGACSETH